MSQIKNDTFHAFVADIVAETVAVTVAHLNDYVAPADDEIHNIASEFITRKEVKSMVKRCDATLVNWAKSGYLVPVLVGGKYLYRKSDVMKILNNGGDDAAR